MACLYIVSTPIGNLGDITYRAVEVLSSVDRVLAEDTRRTSKLFRRYGIESKLYSAHAHNEAKRAEQLLAWLDAGEDVALVSDAGTPLLSDPGARVVQVVVAAGHDVVPVPGASALLAALVGSGVDADTFTFLGFPARKGKAREEVLEQAATSRRAVVFFEAPGRLVRLLHDLAEACGSDRLVAVARELTKLHESFVRGTLAEVAAYYENTDVRGEVVVVLSGAEPSAITSTETANARAMARTLLEQGQRPSDVARSLARVLGLPRNDAYTIALTEAEQTGERG